MHIYIFTHRYNAIYRPVAATDQLIVGLININQLGRKPNKCRPGHKFTRPAVVGLNKQLCNFILDQNKNLKQTRPIGIWNLCPVQESVCHSAAAAHGSHRTCPGPQSSELLVSFAVSFVCATVLVCLPSPAPLSCYLSCNHGTFVIPTSFSATAPWHFPRGWAWARPSINTIGPSPRQRIKWAALCSLHQAAKQF